MQSKKTIQGNGLGDATGRPGQPAASRLGQTLVDVLAPIASLRLTAALFLMSIFIVFAGTLAQTEKDIWQVVHEYFRMDFQSPRAALQSAFAWIDFRIFFPRSFFPEMKPIPWGYGFWFPSGWLIGFVMFLNLTAAHVVRFRVQDRGKHLTRGQLTAGLVTLAVGVVLTLVVIMAGSKQTSDQLQLFTDWPSLRILWLLTQCTLASLVLLAAAIIIFRKRAGIILLHEGIALLMLGELIVGIAAVEGQLQIVEGRTANVVMDTREIELAVIDSSDEKVDDVVAIPQSRMRIGEVLEDKHLPFDIEIVEFLANSELRDVRPLETNLATAGTGLRQTAVKVPQVSGVDTSGRRDHPTVFARLTEKGTDKKLGIYMISLQRWLDGRTERLAVDGRPYDVALRYKHIYQPYSMHLIDVRHDRYMGTQTAKSYSSELRLVDHERNVDRTVRIWMNNPLRFAGATFYQSEYGVEPVSRREYTVLSVVTNTGWRIPYVSCMMVVVGMLFQFGGVLRRFLRRREKERKAKQDTGIPVWPSSDSVATSRQRDTKSSSGKAKLPADPSSLISTKSRLDWAFPLAVVVVSALWITSKAYQPSPREGQLDLAAFGNLPVMYEGRVKPFDTLARNSLRILSDKQTFKDENDDKQPAVRWFLDVITDQPSAQKHRVFRIYNLDLLDTLGLKPRKGFRYSVDDFAERLEEFDKQSRRARETPAENRGLFERKVLELDRKLYLYMMLRESFRIPQLRMDQLSMDLDRETNRREDFSRRALPLAVPPKDGTGDWQAYTHAVFDAMTIRLAQQMETPEKLDVEEPNPASLALVNILSAYDDTGSQAVEFNQQVAAYRKLLERKPPAQWDREKIDFEGFFNSFSPLFYAMILYLFAFVLGCFSWLGWNRPLKNAATWLTLFTLVVHSLALVGRMYISGRPPITNLYSSAIFVGWACVILGLALERVSKIGVANVVAAFTGFAALLVAFLMTTAVPSFKGDSFTVLVAVLDTQFWLATHVTCITAGYSATFLAGFLGIVYVLRGVFTPSLTPDVAKDVGRMIYGTVCFAIFFSFFGTVLGGLWADDSWGRFWGWDPKENGALIIVLWNALVLHSHWARLVGQRGFAVLAIIGNVVTAWSWFGVNELGIGLHTYGFTEGVLMVLGLVVAAHFLIILVGLAPRGAWRSPPAREA